MAESFIGQIRIFSFGYAPKDWAQCSGGSISVAQNGLLYSLIGNTFGGDQFNFNLPDMRGRVPVCTGTVLDLGPLKGGDNTQRVFQGEVGGTETKTLTIEDMYGPHNHNVPAFTNEATERGPADASLAAPAVRAAYGPATNLVPMNPEAVDASCSGQPMNNVQASIVFNFCIALDGNYPKRPQG